MNLFAFFFLLILSSLNGEQPISVCSPSHPFRLTDNKCSNFLSICVKKNDDQCNQLQNACKQCPPSTITVIFLEEILRIVKYKLVKFLIAIFIFNVAIAILLLLENRFKIISKYCFSVIKKKKFNEYKLLHSRKGNAIYSNPTRDSCVKLKFSLSNRKKLIELHVYENDNIIKIKKRICKNWSAARPGFCKIMKLVHNGVILDDNEYLMSYNPSYKDIIKCELDHSLDIKNVLILRVKCVESDSKLVQIDKEKRFFDLNQILHKLLNQSNFVTFVKHVDEPNYSELNNHDLTLEKANVKDKDLIVVVTKKSFKTKISSIIQSENPFEIEISNIEKVSTIFNKVKQEFKSPDFVLMLNHQCLKQGKFMFEYNMDDEDQIKYCRFYDFTVLTENEKPLKKLKEFSQLIKATDNIFNKEVALMRYKFSDWNSFKRNPNLIKELSRLEKVNSSERFVKIYGLYKNASEVGLSMEMMNKSMKDILKSPVNSENIIKWSQKILDGLACLHDHGIIYDNLTMSHILLDSDEDIKLSSISLGKLFADNNSNKTNETYRAPEIANIEPWSTKSDVWSFGVILFEIITGQKFDISFANTDNITNWLNIYSKNITLPKNLHEKFKNIIENCLIINPTNRISVKELQKLII